jgi:hypothetical protein
MGLRTTDFTKARLGAVAIQACSVCCMEMDTIIFKKAGFIDGPEYDYKHVAVEGQVCEFCEFLGMWFEHEGVNTKETGLKYGAAKIVDQDGELFAFVPFSSDEDLLKTLVDGTEFTFKHGMVLECEKTPISCTLTKILKEGV